MNPGDIPLMAFITHVSLPVFVPKTVAEYHLVVPLVSHLWIIGCPTNFVLVFLCLRL